ncbi:MAG: hypothetical protein ACK46X_01645 [Candidatus Sericytochromatia bacterium]
MAGKPVTMGRCRHQAQVLVRIVCSRRREELAAYMSRARASNSARAVAAPG